MNSDYMMKFLASVIISLCLAWVLTVRESAETQEQEEPPTRQRYLPFAFSVHLPAIFLTVSILSLLYTGPRQTWDGMLDSYFAVFAHIGFYYLVLLLLLPLLRKVISARSCAVLWMLPNVLYLCGYDYMGVKAPIWVIRVDSSLRAVSVLWLAGFVGVIVWKIAEHMRFRRHILKDTRPVQEEWILQIWLEVLTSARVKKAKFYPVCSPAVSSPLSIGFFNRTTRVVLPERDYTPEELRWIFQHEVIHICRQDSSNKFFLVFCTAVFWFNPLMWAARHYCSQDLELSCDETTLLQADEDQRQQYARLILTSAGQSQGFTTCLSASASAMRYRLKNIVTPVARYSGGVLIGIVCFALLMTCGYTALAYDVTTGGAVIRQAMELPQGEAPGQYIIGDGQVIIAGDYYTQCHSPEALMAYLEALPVSRLTGNYYDGQAERELFTFLEGPTGVIAVTLQDSRMRVVPLGIGTHMEEYYVNEDVDWTYLISLYTPVESVSGST